MPEIPSLQRLVAILLAAVPMAAAPAPPGPAAQAEAVPVFHLAGQTRTGGTIWAEACGTAALRATPAAGSQPRPDTVVVAALMAALRRGDFETTGVRVVETDDGPLLRHAGTRPGEPGTYFRICHVALHTSYD
jgi:hypothetical protein